MEYRKKKKRDKDEDTDTDTGRDQRDGDCRAKRRWRDGDSCCGLWPVRRRRQRDLREGEGQKEIALPRAELWACDATKEREVNGARGKMRNGLGFSAFVKLSVES
ncbi:hypothetical protein ACLOJK_002787 [Asimina triloba]